MPGLGPSGGDGVDRRHDVVVIGAGPAGEAAADLAGNLGYSVALVERDTVGGTVVTSGGAPTKTFREAAVYLSSFEKEKIYGVALSAPPEVMYPAVRARARTVSERLRKATLDRLRERGVHLVDGEGRLDSEHTVVARTGDGVPGLGRHRPGTPGPVRSARPRLLRARRPGAGRGGVRAARRRPRRPERGRLHRRGDPP